MKHYDMKRKLAAVLAMAMLSGCMPFAALAEGEEGGQPPQEEIKNVFYGASASGHNARLDTSSDGSVSGSAEFSGNAMVVKLYKNGKQIEERTLSQSDSFTFGGQSVGDYAVRFYFWGEGGKAPQKEISVTVGYEKKESEQGTPEDDPPEEEDEEEEEETNETQTNGTTTNSMTTNETPTNGTPTNGTPTNGTPTNGTPTNGTPTNGTLTNGTTTNSTTTNETQTNGTTTNETPTNGTTTNETQTNSTTTNGTTTNETPVAFLLKSAPATVEAKTPDRAVTDASVSAKRVSAAGQSDGEISGTVTYTGGGTLTVKLYASDNLSAVLKTSDVTASGGSFTFTGLPAGTYRVEFCLSGSGGVSVFKTVTVETVAPVKAFTDLTCTATNETEKGKNDGKIDVSVSYTGNTTVYVKLYDAEGNKRDEQEIKDGGGSHTFASLPAGTYRADFHFYGEAASESRNVTIRPGAEPAAKAITAVDLAVKNVTAEGVADGAITGSVSYTGADKVVVKLYAADSPDTEKKTVEVSDGRFGFTELAAGAYQVKFFFEGEESAAAFKNATVGDGTVTPDKAFTALTCTATDETEKGKNDGTVVGSASFTGTSDVYVKLYDVSSPESSKAEYRIAADASGTTEKEYKLDKLSPGSYRVDFHFSGVATASESRTVTIRPGAELAAKSINNVSLTVKDAASKDAKDGEITGSVTYTGEGAVTAKLYAAADLSTEKGSAAVSDGSFSFKELAAGAYQVKFFFEGESSAAAFKNATVGPTEQPESEKLTHVSCSATNETGEGKADGKITGSVSFTGGKSVYVKLYDALDAKLGESCVKTSGDSFAFEGLAAGVYYADFHFDGVSTAAERWTVEVGTEKPPVATIQITGVTPGENKLTVKGTAQAGAQLKVSAADAAGSEVVEALTAGSDGTFSANLLAKAGTYTKVTVYYAADASSAVVKTGEWKVTEPAVKPTLTVDPVDINSTKVVAKTAAGVSVTLTTKDSTQTAVADADGIVQFSLAHTYLKGDTFTLTVVYGSGSGQSFTQTVTVSGSAAYKDLEYGDTGDEVKRLTRRLKELGYPVSEDSRYGSTVREAVRLFQLANGLTADGKAGAATQAVLYSVSAIPYNANRYPTLVRGDRGLSLIYTLQQRLKDLGYYTIKVDGIFGSGTQRAVRLFQRVNGLPETGKADNATQTLLYSSAAKPAYGYVSGDYTTLSRSSRYKSAVVPLQRRLKSLGYYSGSIDGYFGSGTYRAVRNFQSRNGLSVTGVADPYTQEVLYSSYAKKASSSSGSSSSTGYRLLYWGCRGDAVKRLQSALISAGYKSIVRTADGIFGKWTYDAVRAYQKDHGLAVDGIAGKNTQNALYGTHY